MIEDRPTLFAAKCSRKNILFGNIITYGDILRDYCMRKSALNRGAHSKAKISQIPRDNLHPISHCLQDIADYC